MLCPCLRLDDYLSATAAGTCWLFRQHPVGAAGSDGEHRNWCVGVLRTSGKQSRPLGTESRWIGCILLVTTDDFDTILQSDSRTDTEVGVGGIASPGGLDSQLYQMLFLGTQLFHLILLNHGS